MYKLTVMSNPKKAEVNAFHKKYPHADKTVLQKINGDNIRVEISRHDLYVFMVFHLPEYVVRRRSIETVEVNIFYDRKKNDVTVFAFHTDHFFKKYEDSLRAIKYNSFSKFLESLLNLVLADEAKIIEHILQDTRDVKQEYQSSKDSALLIRHLTNNLTNISTLKLICDNQDQLLNKAEEYIRNYEDSPIHYQRNYINEELTYAKEFCQTIMHSINTKYQVRMTDIMYAYTRFTFVIFLTGAVFQVAYAFTHDASPIKITFWFACLATFLGALVMFRRF